MAVIVRFEGALVSSVRRDPATAPAAGAAPRHVLVAGRARDFRRGLAPGDLHPSGCTRPVVPVRLYSGGRLDGLV